MLRTRNPLHAACDVALLTILPILTQLASEQSLTLRQTENLGEKNLRPTVTLTHAANGTAPRPQV